MKRLKRTGQISLGSVLHFILNSFSSIAMYIFVKMGATFVPIIKPNICWKYSPSKVIKLLFKTKSKSSMMKWAFGMTFWNSKHNCLMLFIASSTGMFVYKLLKSMVNRKQFLSKHWVSKSLTRLKLSLRIESNLQSNSFKKCPTNIEAGVKIHLYPATMGRPAGGFFRIFQMMHKCGIT